MTSVPRFILVLFGLTLVAGIGMVWIRQTPRVTERPRVTIGRTSVSAEVVENAALRAKGLGGRTSLSDSAAMVFLTDIPEYQVFWMKNMLIPIDIIWVREGVIVGIEKDAPPPAPGTLDISLARYPSPGLVNPVIEVAAGFAARHHIQVGDSVELQR